MRLIPQFLDVVVKGPAQFFSSSVEHGFILSREEKLAQFADSLLQVLSILARVKSCRPIGFCSMSCYPSVPLGSRQLRRHANTDSFLAALGFGCHKALLTAELVWRDQFPGPFAGRDRATWEMKGGADGSCAGEALSFPS